MTSPFLISWLNEEIHENIFFCSGGLFFCVFCFEVGGYLFIYFLVFDLEKQEAFRSPQFLANIQFTPRKPHKTMADCNKVGDLARFLSTDACQGVQNKYHPQRIRN